MNKTKSNLQIAKMVKKSRNGYNRLKSLFITGLYFPCVVLASDDIFGDVEDKTNDFIEQLVDISTVLCVLCMCICGLMIMFGYFQKKLMMNIIGGAVIILVSTNVGNFLFN